MTVWNAGENRLTASAGVTAAAVTNYGASASLSHSLSVIADPNEALPAFASLSAGSGAVAKAYDLWSYKDLLPPNSTKLERALSIPTGRLTDIDTPIEDVWRYNTCPTDILPWLAWAMSVDFWDNTWPEDRKRYIIRMSFELHRKKGTLYGISAYLRFADCFMRKAIVPPDKAYASRNMTTDERAAWLARFSQIRVYSYRDRGSQMFGAHVGSGFKLGGLYTSDSVGRTRFFPYRTSAAERWGDRAFLWDKGSHDLATGEETPLRWVERTATVKNEIVYDYNEVLIPGVGIGSFFCETTSNHKGKIFPTDGTANSRIVTLKAEREQQTNIEALVMRTVYPALEPIYVFPDHVAERGQSYRGIHMFAGMRGRWRDPDTKQLKPIKCFLKGYVPETTAPLRLYERYYLHDPERLPDRRMADRIFAGKFRLGLPAFNAVMSVEVQSKRPRKQFSGFVWGFVSDGKGSRLKQARSAIQKSMAYRDKILMKTQLHRTVTTADGIISGDGHRAGDLILDL